MPRVIRPQGKRAVRARPAVGARHSSMAIRRRNRSEANESATSPREYRGKPAFDSQRTQCCVAKILKRGLSLRYPHKPEIKISGLVDLRRLRMLLPVCRLRIQLIKTEISRGYLTIRPLVLPAPYCFPSSTGCCIKPRHGDLGRELPAAQVAAPSCCGRCAVTTRRAPTRRRGRPLYPNPATPTKRLHKGSPFGVVTGPTPGVA